MSSIDSLPSSQAAATRTSHNVVLSPFVNERFPAWEDLLSAHDVARLTRRPRWVLAGLVFFGHFPRKRRYRGHGIGWLRSDVLSWLAKDLKSGGSRTAGASMARRRINHPGAIALERTHPCLVRRRREACVDRRRQRP